MAIFLSRWTWLKNQRTPKPITMILHSMMIMISLLIIMTTSGCTGGTPIIGKLILTDISIGGPDNVIEGNTNFYSVTANFDDGSSLQVSNDLTWSIASGPGSISELGLYSAPENIEADVQVTIQVSLTSAEVTKEATKTITVTKIDGPLTGISIDGPDSVIAGNDANFTLTASFDDGTTSEVTANGEWSIFGGPGSFDVAGVFTAPSIVVGETLVTIIARYSEGNIEVETSKVITLLENDSDPDEGTTDPPVEVKISGQVFDADNNPIDGVTINCTYDNLSRISDASGYFSFRVPGGWSGTISAQSSEYTFAEDNLVFENIIGDLPDQDFLATAVASEPAENAAPSASSATVSTDIDTQVNITLAGNDPENETLTYAVLTQPIYGSLTGTAPDLVYTPAASFEGVDSFTFKVNDGENDSLAATISIYVQSVPLPPEAGSWVAPLGIPVPAFGIEESHWDYASASYDYGNGSETYRTAGDGPYTHYVDNTHSQATDTDNPYGSPAKPRKTIPTDYLKAGSIVEIHGGPYSQSVGGVHPMCASGTASKPVYFRGASNDTHPTMTNGLRLRGEYIIVENIKMSNCALTTSSGIAISNASVRYCELSGGGGNALYASSYNGDTITNIVFYKNTIHDKGDIYSTVDEDAGGIATTAGVSYCWIVDNEIYNTSGSGVQIVSGSLSSMSTMHHIYVGRNLVYRTRQSGIWSKQSVDCVFSENTVHSVINTSWSPSKGIGYQYGPERLWIINNHIYDCTFGVAAMSTSGLGFGTEAFIVGNLIHDIHHANDGTSYFNPNSSWSNAGVMLVGVSDNYVINNTIYDVDAGINSPSGGSMFMENNIISNVTESQCQHIFIESSSCMNTSTVKNNLFYQNGEAIRIRWGLSNVYSLPAFISATGKGDGCIEGNPNFVDIANYDFNITSNSPAINAGLSSEVYDRFQSIHGLDIRKDLNGVSRPADGKWDIGAYEYK